MSEVLKQPVLTATPDAHVRSSLRSYLPAILAVAGSVLMVMLRIQVGGQHFISDGALMLLALACYLTAAVFHLMNLYAPSEMAIKVGWWLTTLGVFFNLSSWLVRWVAYRDFEIAEGHPLQWFFRYIPFANLYDLSLAFAFGAGITTLLIAHRRNFRFLGAFSLPLASLILVLARFIGNDFIKLPAVLDSYWRPIHVGVASLSYGVALVCFTIAVIYLLKDGVKVEAMAIASSIFGISVLLTISQFSLLPSLLKLAPVYRASTFILGQQGGRVPLPLRVDIPYVGWALALALLLLVGVIIAFGIYLAKQDENARRWGHLILKLSLVVQACAIALLVAQVGSLNNLSSRINDGQYVSLGKWVAEQQMRQSGEMNPADIARTLAEADPAQLEAFGRQSAIELGPRLQLSLNNNPVEFAALITVGAATLFVILFSFRTERLRAALPSLERLDSMMYKTGSVTFAMLAMLLITGAVWANESWGRYWGWDSKETGALVAWLTYAAFLHTRISRGWTGRPSAYFALLGFLLIIFTYLGVSYLLPGLHSYA
jgi:ABC-type transport system involved in cytochrome c biogenesis permease subunit